MKRQRGRGRKPSHQSNRSFESSGPDVKVRGAASTIVEKYQQLARDAHSSGDRVLAENYLQHADHYFRIVLANAPPHQRSEQIEHLRKTALQGPGQPYYDDDQWDEDDEGAEGELEAENDGGGDVGPEGADDFEPAMEQQAPRERQMRREHSQGQGQGHPQGQGQHGGQGQGQNSNRRRRRQRRFRTGPDGAPRVEEGDGTEVPQRQRQSERPDPRHDDGDDVPNFMRRPARAPEADPLPMASDNGIDF